MSRALGQERAQTYPHRVVDVYPERANFFPLTVEPFPTQLFGVTHVEQGRTKQHVYFEQVNNSEPLPVTINSMRRAIQYSFLAGLKAANYTLSAHSQKIIKRDSNLAPSAAARSLQIFSSFDWQILHFNSHYFLCLDHRLVVRATLALAGLLQLNPSLGFLPNQRIYFKLNGEWDEGKLMTVDTDSARLMRLNGGEAVIAAEDVYPDLTRNQIVQLAPKLRLTVSDLERSIKQLSFLTISDPARARLDACSDFAAQLTYNMFPLSEGNVTVELEPVAATLRPPRFFIGKDLKEPDVSFDHVDQTKRGQITLSGLVKFGAYEKPSSRIRLAVIVTKDSRIPMERLVQRLNQGSQQYPGARKTFGSEMIITETLLADNVNDYENEIRRFVRTPNRDETDVALVHLPKEGTINDYRHPYYRVKALLLKEGLASQMVDRSTVANPDWRDLNLALNLYAKAGNTPWVLDEAMPGVDLFIGLSYSQRMNSRGFVERMMSYVNVFDSYGRWKFYQGDSTAFQFNDRLKHFGELIRNSVAAYKAENAGEIKTVHVHLTKKFSRDERVTLTKAVNSVVPNAAVVYISINTHHNVRLYNVAEGSDGSIGRATYLRNEPNRLYLATTGSNIFNARGMGTPVPLELTVWADPLESRPALEKIAQQILSLTRLNWASTRSFCREPITTKFAGDIASKMTVFMDDPNFSVNPCLRNTPWFL
jgi:hypothetical protein